MPPTDHRFERVLFMGSNFQPTHCYDIGPCNEDDKCYVWERFAYGVMAVAGPFDDKAAGLLWVRKLTPGVERTPSF